MQRCALLLSNPKAKGSIVHANDQNHVSLIELTLVPSRSVNAEAFQRFR
jgi:hypothetical protein